MEWVKPAGLWLLFVITYIVADDLEFLTEPSSRLVKPTDGRVVFRCTVSPSSANVRWLWNGLPVVNSRWIKVSKHKLTVHIARMEKNSKIFAHDRENDYFQCEASLQGKVTLSSPAELIIAVLESFPIQTDIHITVMKNNTAVIPCSPPYSVPNVVTEFLFNDTIIDRSADHYKLMPSGNLQILDAKFYDSGVYTCIANNPFLSEKRQATHKIFLQVIESKNQEAPRFIVLPHSKTSVVLGSNVSLECVATGFPVPSISWRKHQGQLPHARYQQIAGNLFLFGVRRSDEGIYFCDADNSVGSPISKGTIIEVQETPQIVISSPEVYATIGDNVSLNCVARGYPKPVIKWFHNGKLLTSKMEVKIKESQLLLFNVSYKQSGIYQCFASNKLDTVYATSFVSVHSGNDSFDEEYDSEDYDDYDEHETNPPSYHHNRDPLLSKFRPNYNEHNLNNDNDGAGFDSDLINKHPHKKKRPKGVKLIPPSKPEVTRLSDTSVMVRWGVPRNDGLPILFFKVQYREFGRKSSHWMTIDEDIAAHIHSYAVTDLHTGGKYRFRIAAVYSNNDNKLGPNSDKFVLYKDPPMKKPVIGPIITHAEAVSPSAITLYWEYSDIDSVPIDGFFIHYRTTHSAGDYLKIAVLGANTRSHIISHLLPDTSYDIKTQCFNDAGTSEFSNIYTCKTKPSEDMATRNKNIKSHNSDDATSLHVTEPVSSKSSDGNFILYVVAGVICGVMVMALSVFLTLYLRQKQSRHPNTSAETNRIPAKVNGHVSNGYSSGANKINISINPLSQFDSDDSDKPDQFEDIVSNNNEIIHLQTFTSNEGLQGQSLQAQDINETITGKETDAVILSNYTEGDAVPPTKV